MDRAARWARRHHHAGFGTVLEPHRARPKDTAGEAYRLIPLSLDPPEYRPFRNLLNDNLSPKALAGIDDKITELTVSRIESFRSKGRCDFIHYFAEQLRGRIFMQVIDLPVADLPKLKHLADQFTRPDGSLTYPQVLQLFRDYLDPVITGRCGKGGTDMISRTVNGLAGGRDSVVNLMGFAMALLARHDVLRRTLAADPRGSTMRCSKSSAAFRSSRRRARFA